MTFLNLIKIYAKQIIQGNKVFNNVPENIKKQVKEELIKLNASKKLYEE